LETLLKPDSRVLNGRYLEKGKEFIVQLHEDILKILVALCPELFPNDDPPSEDEFFPDDDPRPKNEFCPDDESASKKMSLEAKAHAMWERIFGYPFKITCENRMFEKLESGMFNVDDKERNIAFKVDTFLGLLDNIYSTLEKQYGTTDSDTFKKTMAEALQNAGMECGRAFGKALIDQWKNENKTYDQDQKIKTWCEFDTRAGFGQMDYDPVTSVLSVKNLFILDCKTVGKRDNSAFFTGYVKGVLSELVDPNIDVTLPPNGIDGTNISYTVNRS